MTPARIGENQMLQEPDLSGGERKSPDRLEVLSCKKSEIKDCENEVLHGPNPLRPGNRCRGLEVNFMPITKRSRTSQIIPTLFLFGAPEILRSTIEFHGGVDVELTQKSNSKPPPSAFCPKVQSRSPAKCDPLTNVSLDLETKSTDVDVAYLFPWAVCTMFMKRPRHLFLR